MSGRLRKVYLVCYDITEDGRRTAVYHALRGAGERLQYSVFRCVLSDVQLARLKSALQEHIDVRADQVMFVFLGTEDTSRAWHVETLGRPVPAPERVVHIL